MALNAAPTRRVIVIERRSAPRDRIGESLPPAARRLLQDMGLLDSFLLGGHQPYHANVSVWGDSDPVVMDFIRGVDGHGWHLDRSGFEGWLREVAVSRGATFLTPARVDAVDGADGRWRLHVRTDLGPRVVTARILVDASGRAAAMARRCGASRQVLDRLICGWVYGSTAPGSDRGLTHVEAAPDGWWYTAPLPGDGRVLAFHTDSDLPAAAAARRADLLMARASSLPTLASVLTDCDFTPTHSSGVTAASSVRLNPPAGPGWFATGDAALGLDPLSSQGLLNALFTGLAAAEAADRYLDGATDSVSGYCRMIERIFRVYRAKLRSWYAAEARWPNASFWSRRRLAAPVA